jgi:hypothetical protein
LHRLSLADDDGSLLGAVAKKLCVLWESLGNRVDEADNWAAVKREPNHFSLVVVVRVRLFIGVDRDGVTICVS